MRNHPLCFLFGFAIGYLPVLYFLANIGVSAPQALAEETQATEEIVVVMETLAPAEDSPAQVLAAAEETVVAETPKPTPKQVATAKPSPRSVGMNASPTPAPTESPEPSPVGTVSSAAVAATANPVPVETPIIGIPVHLEPWFTQYSNEYKVDRNMMAKIADCESGFNAAAANPNGLYVGMFQFAAGTWQTYRGKDHMNLDANLDLRTNPEESIKTAAYAISRDGTGPWGRCD